VGVRTKGNSTLLFNAAKGWDRFSLVLEFDAFQESQRYYGPDSVLYSMPVSDILTFLVAVFLIRGTYKQLNVKGE
jgi:hypothetical protein